MGRLGHFKGESIKGKFTPTHDYLNLFNNGENDKLI
jgi:hypothetical protein